MKINDIIDEIITSSRTTKFQKDAFSAYRFMCPDEIFSEGIYYELDTDKSYIVMAFSREAEFMIAYVDSFDEACSILKDKWCIDYTDNIYIESLWKFAILHNGKVVRNNEVERYYRGIECDVNDIYYELYKCVDCIDYYVAKRDFYGEKLYRDRYSAILDAMERGFIESYSKYCKDKEIVDVRAKEYGKRIIDDLIKYCCSIQCMDEETVNRWFGVKTNGEF